jgi:hypothetical protein
MSTTITFSGLGVLTQAIVSSQLTTQTTVIIDGYTSIGANAFEDANTVTSIFIPNTVTSIGESALGPMVSLIAINVAIDNSYYLSDNGILFDVTGTTLIQYPIGNTQTSYIIPDGVTSIGDYAFQNSNLSTITFPDSITIIGQYAFQYSNLSQIVIPSGLQTIGIYAFFNNITLTTIIFENNSELTSIGNYAFATDPGNSILTSINIPASVTSIGDYAFQKSNLSTITFHVNSVLTSIGDYAFGYSKISEIIIPRSILTIGNNTFFLCVLLVNIQIDLTSNLLSIGDNAFAGTNITSINIPPSVQTIGNNAFNGLQNIQVYSEYINNLNLIQQTYPYFYGAINANVILYGSPPPTPTQQPAQQSAPYSVNGRGPIQICTSRLANCKITKTNFQNGYVINNRATAMQRISTLISVQSQMRNATWTQIYAPVNAYSQRTGGPVGYGQSPKNTF